ncbi:hypothetical protein GHK86_14070 [Acidimicrobiaceae bacterium USS-CC1]|uniref:Uncharacterized protein n=1 Tax=Acidiferrimicrobium australe TaxID=2664430 RepID=A0ABW9QVF1_9ACTN|nr:hypothetical protein [Acidiferrimicrobium australe]
MLHLGRRRRRRSHPPDRAVAERLPVRAQQTGGADPTLLVVDEAQHVVPGQQTGRFGAARLSFGLRFEVGTDGRKPRCGLLVEPVVQDNVATAGSGYGRPVAAALPEGVYEEPLAVGGTSTVTRKLDHPMLADVFEAASVLAG